METTEQFSLSVYREGYATSKYRQQLWLPEHVTRV